MLKLSNTANRNNFHHYKKNKTTMRLKEIHDEYCEKQRIAEEEAVRLENDRKQKELEEQIAKEKEIIERLKPLFLQQFDEEIKAIEEAGISIKYSAKCSNESKLYIELFFDGMYNCIYFRESSFCLADTAIVRTKQELMSLIYQHFFC